jgi:hypothetical protein
MYLYAHLYVQVQTALDTIELMLTKLAAANKDDNAKFKCIRVMNGGFQTRYVYIYIYTSIICI